MIGKETGSKSNPFADSLKSIIQCTPGSLYWKNKDGYYLGCNQFMVTTSGLDSINDIIGKSDYDLWPESAKNIVENDKYVMETEETLFIEESVVVAGKLMYFTGVKMPLRDKRNNIIGIIGNSLDVTDLKNAENEIAKIKGMGAIGGSIAHELRTPLGSIESATNALKRFFPTLLNAYLVSKSVGLDVEEIHPKHLESPLTLS